MKCTKLVDLLQSLNMNTPEFPLSHLQGHKLCVSSKTHTDVVVLVVRVVFLCLVVWYVLKFLYFNFIKLACIRRRCGMKENILNFALSPSCFVYI